MSTNQSCSAAALPSVARAKEDGNDPHANEPHAKKHCKEHSLMRGVRSITDEFAGVPSNSIWLTIACFMEEEERERVFQKIIPELKGMDLLADAKVASLNARKMISWKINDDYGRGVYVVREENMALLFPAGIKSFINEVNGPHTKPKKPTNLSDMAKKEGLSPEVAKAFASAEARLLEVNGPDTKPKKPTNLYDMAKKEDLSPEVAKALASAEARLLEQNARLLKLNEKNYKLDCSLWPVQFGERIENALLGKEHLYSTKSPMSMLSVAQDHSVMWFEWGADKCGFDSSEKFDEFCALAGVDPTQAINSIDFNYCHEAPNLEARIRDKTWVSHDRKVTFTASCDPRGGGYCHYFGCTGVRPRCKFLFEWFKKNGTYAEYCWNGRSFI